MLRLVSGSAESTLPFTGNAGLTMSRAEQLTPRPYGGDMARISKPPVPLQMYKHFAVITVVLTATLALFADGENREALNEHLEERQREQELQAASQQITGPPRLVRADTGLQGSFGEESDSSYGRPMDDAGSGGSTSRPRRSSAVGRQLLPNMTADEVAALSQEEYDRLRALYAAAGAIEDVDRSAQMSEIEAASARRMGHSGADS